MPEYLVPDVYHAHVYFDESTAEAARELRRAIGERFSCAALGNVNERPRGPHPRWSFEVAFEPSAYGELVPWLADHRCGLAVLVHPYTRDEVVDHTERAVWMGEILDLRLEALG